MCDADLLLACSNFPQTDWLELFRQHVVGESEARRSLSHEDALRRRRLEPQTLPPLKFIGGWIQLLERYLGTRVVSTLLDYQKEAICRGLQWDGKILMAMPPGTGKTLVTICSIVMHLQAFPNQRVLIVCPLGAMDPWQTEMARWFGIDESMVDTGKQETTRSSSSSSSASKRRKKKVKKAKTSSDTASPVAEEPDQANYDDDWDDDDWDDPSMTRVRRPLAATKRILLLTWNRATARIDELKDLKCTMAVYDEGHALKHGSAQRTQALVPLMQSAHWRKMLTGTPGSVVIEMFHLLNAVRPEMFPDFHAFGKAYCDVVQQPVGPAGNRWTKTLYKPPKDPKRLDQLNALLYQHVMFRVDKAQALKHLPAKYTHVIRIDALTEPEQVELAEAIRALEKKVSAQVPTTNPSKKRTHSTMVQGKLAFAPTSSSPSPPSSSAPSSAPSSVPSPTAAAAATTASSPGGLPIREENELQRYTRIQTATVNLKLPVALANLRQRFEQGWHKDQKILLFAHHAKILNYVQGLADELQIGYMRIDGKVTSPFQRGLRVARFQDDPTCRLAILSITACATAITLTAGSQVIFLELHPDPPTMHQAEDRAHRLGQKRDVHVEYWILKGSSADEGIYRNMKNKDKHMEYTLRLQPTKS